MTLKFEVEIIYYLRNGATFTNREYIVANSKEEIYAQKKKEITRVLKSKHKFIETPNAMFEKKECVGYILLAQRDFDDAASDMAETMRQTGIIKKEEQTVPVENSSWLKKQMDKVFN